MYNFMETQIFSIGHNLVQNIIAIGDLLGSLFALFLRPDLRIQKTTSLKMREFARSNTVTRSIRTRGKQGTMFMREAASIRIESATRPVRGRSDGVHFGSLPSFIRWAPGELFLS
jgi:hypothetical protein